MSTKLVEIEQPSVLAPLPQAVKWVKPGGKTHIECNAVRRHSALFKLHLRLYLPLKDLSLNLWV